MEYPHARREIRDFPPGPPILIAGTHRSGTTWFASMLAEPGLWYVHEPFNPNKHLWPESFTYAAPGSLRPDVDRYFEALLRGEYRSTSNNSNTDHWLMPLRLARPPIGRVMVKDPLGCLLTGYLAARFDLQVRVLFRHPAGFVSSVTRLGWPVGGFLKDFLGRSDLMSDHLEPWRDLMAAHVDRNDAKAAAVLHGALNVVLWNQVQENPSIVYYLFEDLCAEPLERFETIFRELALPYNHQTRQRHVSLCLEGADSPAGYRPHAVARRSGAMATSWKSQLSEPEVLEIRDIWNSFSIPSTEKMNIGRSVRRLPKSHPFSERVIDNALWVPHLY